MTSQAATFASSGGTTRWYLADAGPGSEEVVPVNALTWALSFEVAAGR